MLITLLLYFYYKIKNLDHDSKLMVELFHFMLKTLQRYNFNSLLLMDYATIILVVLHLYKHNT